MSDPTSRVLQLLGLLQSRTSWTAVELAERLGVTDRSVRRDVQRLRDLGYPVRASRGLGGGYQLGAGGSLPPLLLDPEEAVAVAVCLRLAAGGTVAGVGEAALRTLTKLDQVLPTRLREQVAAVQQSTVAVPGFAEAVDPDVLVVLARGCRDTTEVRFDYTSRAGEVTSRRAEPYRLVARGQRWYLLGYDRAREDWRSFRLDRMSGVRATTWRFRPRESPDPAAYITASVTRSPYRYVVRVRFAVPAAELAEQVPANAGEITTVGEHSCELSTGAMSLRWAVVHLLALDLPFQVLDPPELAEELRRVAQLADASASTAPSASTT